MPTDIKQLLEKYLLHTITVEEKRQLFEMLRSANYGKELEAIIDEQLAAGDFTIEENDETRELIFEKILRSRKGKVRKMLWVRWAAAAAIILMVGLAIVISKQLSNNRHNEVAITPQDVEAPKETKAMITLADGRKVSLDSLTSITQNNVTLIKTADGKIIYNSKFNIQNSTLISYNTLTNPRGSKVQSIMLIDGTQVWLNAESSITYPTAFTTNERKVEITGEAFFSVTHNAKQPFKVVANGTEIQDLGTEFNVNAYPDEDAMKTTLIEGSIQITSVPSVKNSVPSVVKLKPGQQAIVTLSTSDKLATGSHEGSNLKSQISNVDVEQVTAWKNDRFIFSGDNIQSVMRQLARWYDVEINYQGNIPNDEFVGVISRSRNENISAILNMLERTKTVKFKIEGKKITVMNNK